MQKLFRILLIGFTFIALNVGTVAAQTGMTQPPVTDGMPSCAATSPDFVDNGVCDGSAGSAPMGGNTGMTPMSGDTSGILPTADNSAAPINEGRDMDVGSHRAAPIGDAEESGGPAGQHMNREINDGGFGANSGAEAEKARIAAEAQAAAKAAAKAEADRLAAKEEQAQNSCKVTLNEIDVRTFRDCKSAEERVDEMRGAVCTLGLMWHNKYEREDIKVIRECKEVVESANNGECSSALKDLDVAIEAFNANVWDDETRVPVKYQNGQLQDERNCYEREAGTLRRAHGKEKQCDLIQAKDWWETGDVASVNESWRAARDACIF
jgi:hypothetical protein